MTQIIPNPADMPPYPRLGEIYRTFALSVDTKNKNRNVDRLAREGEYDWSLLETLREELILTPLRKYTDSAFTGLLDQFIQHLHQSYLGLVSTVCLDSLSRNETMPLLIENYFSLLGTVFIFDIKKEFGGPDLLEFLDPVRHPISVVFNWADEGGVVQLAKVAFPETTGADKTNRDMVARWEQADQLPKLTSIKNFTDALSNHVSPTQKEKVSNLRRWLIVARAITWLEQEAAPVPIKSIMRRHLLSGLPDSDIRMVLSKSVLEAGERLSPLNMPALTLYENLKRTVPKKDGDQAKTKQDLDELVKLTAKHDPEGRTQFHLEWLMGRWQVLSGDYKNALLHYQRAVELANYRAGENQRPLVEEAFVLAGYLGKKTFLNQLKHWAIAFHLFASPRGDNTIEDWEIDQWRQQFHQVFPITGRFAEVQIEENKTVQLPFLAFSEDEMKDKRADLRNPDRVFTIHFADGQTRRWPQLRFYASMGRIAEVRSLLDKAASVDQLDESGGSALLCAIQHATNTGEREVLDLLLRQDHANETLNKATNKKQLTPLICAIEFGEPDVVERLLEMGAIADRRGNLVDETPLYLCITKLGCVRNPAKLFQYIRQNFLAKPDLAQREALRRYNVSLAGVFGDSVPIKAALKNSEYQNILNRLVFTLGKEEIAHHSIPKLVRIAELLVKNKANPNAPHQYPEPGRTPLMLAAENNSGLAFDTLIKFGGDPYQKDVAGRDCLKIAHGFAANEIVSYLRASGYL